MVFCESICSFSFYRGFPVAQLVKNLPAMQETLVWFLGSWKSPGEGNSYPLKYSGLENSMDCIVHGVTKSWAWLSDFHFTYFSFSRSLRLQRTLLTRGVAGMLSVRPKALTSLARFRGVGLGFSLVHPLLHGFCFWGSLGHSLEPKCSSSADWTQRPVLIGLVWGVVCWSQTPRSNSKVPERPWTGQLSGKGVTVEATSVTYTPFLRKEPWDRKGLLIEVSAFGS